MNNEIIYNVCAFIGENRIMKEMLTAQNRKDARRQARIALKARGFTDRKIRIEVLEL
jgi:hypothetical protein